MSFGKRVWRVARGLGGALASSVRPKKPGEQEARREAEAELERLAQERPASAAGSASDVDAVLRQTEPPAAPSGPDYPLEEAGGLREDASLAACYAVLGLPPGSSMARVEHAYQRLKAEKDPEQLADDPIAQARARQEVARLDEAYLTLRRALVRERRL